MKYLPLLLMLFYCSCNSKLKTTPIYCESETIEIDTTGMSLQIKAENYQLKNIRPLNFNVPYISEIQITKTRIYIFDAEITKMLYCFDNEGNLLAKLGERGHSKIEFIDGITDFSVNKETEQVYAFESESRKIVVFDKNGDFQRTIYFKKFWPYAFSLLPSGNFAISLRMRDLYSDENFELLIIDENENIINKYLYLDKDHLFTPNERPFVNKQLNSVCFIPNMCYNLYCIKNDSIAKQTYVDFGTHKLTSDERTNIKYNVHETSINLDAKVKFIDVFYDNDYYNYMEYNYSGVQMKYLRDKRTTIEYGSTSLFEGFLPSKVVYINDSLLGMAITADHKSIYDAIRSENETLWKDMVEKTDKKIIDILEQNDENFKAHLVFVEISNSTI